VTSGISAKTDLLCQESEHLCSNPITNKQTNKINFKHLNK
jgi:hypothetical protein